MNRKSFTCNFYNSAITVGFEFESYTTREGSGVFPVCAVRLRGTINRKVTLVMTALPDFMSEGNASSCKRHTITTILLSIIIMTISALCVVVKD